MKIFISIPKESEVFRTFLNEEVRAYIEKAVEVEYSPYPEQVTPEQLTRAARECDAILTGWGHPQISYDMIAQTAVKLIVHTGGSVGSLVTPDIYEAGVRVLSGNQIYAESVAEGTIAYMLMGLRSLPDYVNQIRKGGWKLGNDYTKGLMNRTVGLIGAGAISTFLAKKLQVFHVKIKWYSSYPLDETLLEACHAEAVSLEEALQCDIVSLHSAMNERTRGMIGAEQFALIRDGALFVNTARGRIVDEEAMIEELKKKRFQAVLDVYYEEPLGSDSPLRHLENVYCIPHLAGPTIDLRPVITMSLVDNLVLFEQGVQMPLEISREHAARMTVGG